MVSVIVPVYNTAPYLREALDSVIKQTYPDLQIIVVDDGSKDESRYICDEYLSDSRVTVIHMENRGLSVARNTGLDIASGEYIAFLDSDDIYHPCFIQNMLNAIKDVDLVICRYTMCLDRFYSGLPDAPQAEEGYYNRNNALRALAEGKINTGIWNKLYKRELWTNLRFPEGCNYEDIDTMYRILNFCDSLYVLGQPLYYYRKRSGSITRTYTLKNIEDKDRAFLHLEEFIEKHIPEIFMEEHLKEIRNFRLEEMLSNYLIERMDTGSKVRLREKIIATGEKNGIEWSRFRLKAGYQIVRYCPWLLRILYPIYRRFRILMLKSTSKNEYSK